MVAGEKGMIGATLEGMMLKSDPQGRDWIPEEGCGYYLAIKM